MERLNYYCLNIRITSVMLHAKKSLLRINMHLYYCKSRVIIANKLFCQKSKYFERLDCLHHFTQMTNVPRSISLFGRIFENPI